MSHGPVVAACEGPLTLNRPARRTPVAPTPRRAFRKRACNAIFVLFVRGDGLSGRACRHERDERAALRNGKRNGPRTGDPTGETAPQSMAPPLGGEPGSACC